MDLYEMADQIVKLLQQRGKLTYRVLKLQFELDDETLEALKGELLYSQPQAVDDNGKGLIWTGGPAAPEPDARHRIESDLRFHALLPMVIGLLRAERRVTYRALKDVLGLGETLLEKIREELTLRQLAVDEEGKVLVWAGETQPIVPSVVDVPSPPATSVTSSTVSIPLSVTESRTPSNGPTASPEIVSTDVLQDEPVGQESIRSTPEAERRQLTVMFCDLADSTRLSQQLDPEDLREVVRAYQTTAAEVIRQYEGHMAQYLGDGLLVYFGWPQAHEDDAKRALHAGLGIVEATITTLNPRLEREKGVQLTVRIGVHTGPVVVGEMGGGGYHENLATGETVNIAARLEGLASPNTVVISGVTERLVRSAFALNNLGPQMLKGIADPTEVFRVLRPLDSDRDEDEHIPDGGVFLVGRDEEVGLLLRRWEQSKEGLGQVVLISGEAGIGKSSLVATMRQQVVKEGYTRIAFRCSPYHTNSALYPVIGFVQRVLDFQADDTPATRLDKLERVLGGYSRPLEEVVPLYAALLSVPVPEERYAALNLSPQQQRQQTQDALVGWLLEEAERHPTLAMWEDLHWADPSTLEMLGLILEQTPTVSMLHVLTFRPVFEPPWPSRSHLTPVTLNRLERAQVEALITRMAQGKALPTEVVEHIVGKTDGVPLYVEELTKMLLASGLLQEEANAYALTGPLTTVTIPDTLQDSLMARLDQMNTAKEVAQLGAVLGREFSYDMLLAISSQDDTTLQTSLAQLVGAELLYQRGRPPRANYLFKHALIQDAAYASLLKNTRQRVHQQIAQLFERHSPELVETQPELVAHHYTEAGLIEQAISYWQQAGQRASERSAYPEAISHLSTGLNLLQTLPESLSRDQRELALQIALGAASLVVRGHTASEVEVAYTRAHVLCQQLGDTQDVFPVLFGLWRFYVVRPDFTLARQLGDELLALAERGNEPHLYVMAHYAVGFTCFCLGDLASARRHSEEGIACYTPAQRRFPMFRAGQDPGVACRVYAGCTLWVLGYPDQALTRAHEALSLATEFAHPFTYAFALELASVIWQLRREAQVVYDHTDAAVTLSSEQGFTLWLAIGTFLRGWALTALGQREEGLTQMCQGLTDWRASGAWLFVPHFLSLMGEGVGAHGQVEAGLDALHEGLEVMARTGEYWWQAEGYRLKGELLLLQSLDNQAEAEAALREALSVARRQHAKSWELRAATSLARLWQSQGKRQEAHDLLKPVYDWFTEGFDTADLKEAKALLDEPA